VIDPAKYGTASEIAEAVGDSVDKKNVDRAGNLKTKLG
jgi:hypothetical protein